MVAFEIGSIKIYWYGIFYFTSFILGYLFFIYIRNKGYFKIFTNLNNLLEKGLEDIVLAIFLGVLVGGRLAHVLLYNPMYYLSHPIEVFYIWNGGMGFVGGVIGVIIGLYIIKILYKLSFKEFLLLIDILVAFVPFGIMIGRIGNFLNQELYGKAIASFSHAIQSFASNLGLVHVYDKVDTVPRLNTNFIESFLEGFLLLCINQAIFWKKYIYYEFKPGLISGTFLIGYGIFRFIVEFLRDYSVQEYIWIFTKTQYLMIGFIILGLYLLIRKSD